MFLGPEMLLEEAEDLVSLRRPFIGRPVSCAALELPHGGIEPGVLLFDHH